MTRSKRCKICLVSNPCSNSPRPRWRGFSFALHPDPVQGFLFARIQYERLQRVLPCKCNYTAHATKQHTGLYNVFSGDCTHSTAADTRPTQAAIIPPVPRWRAYTRPDALNRYQIPPPRRDAVQVSTAAYYNKVYKRANHASGGEAASTLVNLARVGPAAVSILPTPG